MIIDTEKRRDPRPENADILIFKENGHPKKETGDTGNV
jgi:hypothetical protein